MKKRVKQILICVIICLKGIILSAQSTNPLNYSGKMYLEAIEIYSTPRYVSYEDHAILSREMRIPSVKVATVEMDYEKGFVIAAGKQMKVKVLSTKKYSERGWVVVIYLEMPDEGDKAELVWSQYGKPYLQQITQTTDGVKIARMVLSSTPYIASEQEAMMNLMMSL